MDVGYCGIDIIISILYKRDPEVNYKGSESYRSYSRLYEMDPELKYIEEGEALPLEKWNNVKQFEHNFHPLNSWNFK